MATPRPTRPRLIVGASALVAVAVAAALPLLDPGPLEPLVRWAAAFAIAAGAVGVVGGFPAWGSVTAGVLGAELLLTLHERPPALDARTPMAAAGLLLVAELVTWAAELRTAGTVVGRPRPSRLTVLAAATVAAYVGTLALGLVVTLPVGRDLAVSAGGAAAVALVTIVLVGLARRSAAATATAPRTGAPASPGRPGSPR